MKAEEDSGASAKAFEVCKSPSSAKVAECENGPRLTPYAYTTVLLAAVGGLLFGYDIGVIGGCLTLDGFRSEMGWPPAIEECGPDSAPEPKQVSFEQGWITSAFMFGCFVASPFAGYFSDRFGRWTAVMLGTFVFFVGGALQTGANGVGLMIAGRAVSGLSIGVLSTVVPLYIAEVSPASLRGTLVTLQQLGITFGILVAFLFNLFVQKVIPRDWDWRVSLGFQCFIALLMGVGMLFMPESPRYLAWRGRVAEAKAVLRKLRGEGQESLLSMEILEIEKEVAETKSQNSTWSELFSRKLALTMLVGIFIPTVSQFSGINAIMLYSATIFNNMCLSGIAMTAIVGVVNFLFTFVAVFFSDRCGRKPLLLTGASGMVAGLVASAAILWTVDYSENKNAANAIVFLIMFFIANYASTWGAVASWIIPSEVFPIRVRGKAIGLATMGNWAANVIVAFLTPILIRPDVANVSGTFFFYASFLIIAIPFVVCLVPETKGVPLEEMEEKFSKPLGQHVRSSIADLRRRPAAADTGLPK